MKLIETLVCDRCNQPVSVKDEDDDLILEDVITQLADETHTPPNVVYEILVQMYPKWMGLRDPGYILDQPSSYFWAEVPKQIRRMTRGAQ